MRARNLKNNRKNKFKYLLTIIILISVITGFWMMMINSRWNGRDRFNFLYISLYPDGEFESSLFSIEPKVKRGVYMNIPKELTMKLPKNYGTYKFSSIYKLAGLDEATIEPVDLIVRSIELTYGLSIDGFLLSKNENKEALPTDTDEFRVFKKVNSGFFIIPSLFIKHLMNNSSYMSDMAIFDKFKIWRAFASIRADKFEAFGPQAGFYEKVILPDGSSVKKLNDELFDLQIAVKVHDFSLRSLNLSAEVINSSGYDGLAGDFKRILESMGVNVVSLGTSNIDSDEPCFITGYSKNEGVEYLSAKLKRKYKCQLREAIEIESQSDIVITLSKGFIE